MVGFATAGAIRRICLLISVVWSRQKHHVNVDIYNLVCGVLDHRVKPVDRFIRYFSLFVSEIDS